MMDLKLYLFLVDISLLNNDIKYKGVEYNILDLIGSSTEIDNEISDEFHSSWWYYRGNDEYFYEDESDKRLQNKYRERHFNRINKNK
jgi:hypothetical protein